MPSFDDSFIAYCENTERKRKHSYNFNSARKPILNSGTSAVPNNLLATAKSYSKTLPRSFRKNLLKISQYIRDTGSGSGEGAELHFYDLNHNEVSPRSSRKRRGGGGGRRGRQGVTAIKWGSAEGGNVGEVEDKGLSGDYKVISMDDLDVSSGDVELLAKRSLEELCYSFEASEKENRSEEDDEEEEEETLVDDGDTDENNSKWSASSAVKLLISRSSKKASKATREKD